MSVGSSGFVSRMRQPFNLIRMEMGELFFSWVTCYKQFEIKRDSKLNAFCPLRSEITQLVQGPQPSAPYLLIRDPDL